MRIGAKGFSKVVILRGKKKETRIINNSIFKARARMSC